MERTLIVEAVKKLGKKFVWKVGPILFVIMERLLL